MRDFPDYTDYTERKRQEEKHRDREDDGNCNVFFFSVAGLPSLKNLVSPHGVTHPNQILPELSDRQRCG